MKKYKVWLYIEEIDEDDDIYNDLEEHIVSIGPEFSTEQEAVTLKENILTYVNAEDTCPICQSELIAGPNDCTICSKDGCAYWRE